LFVEAPHLPLLVVLLLPLVVLLRPAVNTAQAEQQGKDDDAYLCDPVGPGLGVPRFTDAAIVRAFLRRQTRLRQIQLFQKHFAFGDNTRTYLHRSSLQENPLPADLPMPLCLATDTTFTPLQRFVEVVATNRRACIQVRCKLLKLGGQMSLIEAGAVKYLIGICAACEKSLLTL
jgi:hypothetical protein